MPLSELEAHAYKTDLQVREVLLRMLKHKAEVQQALQEEDISVLKEEQLKSALAEITSQVDQYKFSGSF
jgi:hypothetical protein